MQLIDKICWDIRVDLEAFFKFKRNKQYESTRVLNI